MFNGDNWEYIYTEWWKVLLLVLAVTAAVIIAYFLTAYLEKKNGNSRSSFTTKDLTYGAVALASSFTLSYIKLYEMPSGGSITLASILPIAIYCYFFGFKKGLVICFASMCLQLLQKPYIVSPWSALLDYVIPYLAPAFVGLISFSPEKYTTANNAGKKQISSHSGFFIGIAIYFVIRFASHVLAGVMFWADGIDFMIWQGNLSGMAAFLYSATYNAIFLVPDTLITVIAGFFCLSNKAFNTFMAKSMYTLKHTDTAAKYNQ